jgi:hypothetical protein
VEPVEHLRRLGASTDASWYALEGEPASPIERYVLSTSASREVCNRPERRFGPAGPHGFRSAARAGS